MQIVKLQFAAWDKIYDFANGNHLLVKTGDYVFVETEMGKDIGLVLNLCEQAGKTEAALKNVVRIASAAEVEQALQSNDYDEMLNYCRTLVRLHNLPMKIVGVHCSYDKTHVKFAFVADGRVDFRDLVKELIQHFKKSVILYQLGVRDEAKICGDIGRCGNQQLCCGRFLHTIGGVTSDMTDVQQVAHRGSERLSGQCGRLMCCLKYEEEGYRKLVKDLPAIGAKLKYENMAAEVIGWHTLKKSVDLKVYDKKGGYEKVFDVSVNDLKY